MNVNNYNERIRYAYESLLGLSVGDALGETFFGKEDEALRRISCRELRSGKWSFTDDTIMGIAIYKTLERSSEISQDILAAKLAENYNKDIYRGYGGTAHSILRSITLGEFWEDVSKGAFDGMGSMGNGAAMRVAPIGAFFHDDLKKIKEQARLSAQVTHYNEEGIAGAIGVALASGITLSSRLEKRKITANEFIDLIYQEMPESDTKYKVRKGIDIPKDSSIDFIVSVLGNGVKVIAQDTVPFAIWCIANYMNSYEEAFWKAVSALGDRDTICAIVGSVVVLNTGVEAIPSAWRESTESFDGSVFW